MKHDINSPGGWTAIAVAFAAGVGGSLGYNFLQADDTDRYYGIEGRAVEERVHAVEVRMAGDIATIKSDISHIKTQMDRHLENHGTLPR